MANYIISACSYSDMPVERMKEIDVKYICTPYMVNGEIFYDDLGETTDYEKFYQSMRDGAVTSTFQLNQDDFADYFRELLKTGKDLIHVSLSSGLSGVSPDGDAEMSFSSVIPCVSPDSGAE